MKSVEERVIAIVEDASDKAGLGLDTNIVSDLGFDSLDRLDLYLTIEDEFEVEISDNKADNLVTIQDIVNLIKGY